MPGLYCLVILFAVGTLTQGQDYNELQDDLKKQLKEQFGNLSTDLPPNFNVTQLQNEALDALKKKCEQNAGTPDVADEILAQQDSVRTCLEGVVNTTALQQEVEEAKKTGAMDEVFGKYCNKFPEIKACLVDSTEVVKKCLDPKEQEHLNITLNIVNDLKDFVCFKDGDRIAMFIAEHGLECLREQEKGIQSCLNKTIQAKIPQELTISALPNFIYTDEVCTDFSKIRNCFISELEKCKDTTPANIVEAFFKFLGKQLPCKVPPKEPKVQEVKTDGASTTLTSLSLIAVMFLFNLINFTRKF